MRRTLRVACACVLFFSLMFILYMLFVSYGLVLFTYILSCILLTVRSAENKLRKGKSALLQGAGLYIAKNKTRLENKCEKSKESGKRPYT